MEKNKYSISKTDIWKAYLINGTVHFLTENLRKLKASRSVLSITGLQYHQNFTLRTIFTKFSRHVCIHILTSSANFMLINR